MTEEQLLELGFHRTADGWHRETRMLPDGYSCPVCWARDWGAIENLTADSFLTDPLIPRDLDCWGLRLP